MDRFLQIMIVDDEPLAVERLRLMCSAIEALAVVGSCNDGPSLLAALPIVRPDVVLLDIAMPGLNGIEVARALETTETAVIFVTAHHTHALDAFEVSALDYLLKPVTSERLERAIRRARTQARPVQSAEFRSNRELWVRSRGEMLRIVLDEVEVFEAERDYVRLHIGDRSHLVHHTIKSMQAKLDPAKFIRVHRSTIVRRDQVRRLTSKGAGVWTVELIDGRTYSIGGSYLVPVKALTDAFQQKLRDTS